MLSLNEFASMLDGLSSEKTPISGDMLYESAASTKHASLFVAYTPDTGVFKLGIEIAEDISKAECRDEDIVYVCESAERGDLIERYERALAGMLSASEVYETWIKAAKSESRKEMMRTLAVGEAPKGA